MKKTMIGMAVLLAAVSVNAQTSSTTATGTTPEASPTQTSTVSATTAAPAAAKKFGAVLIYEGFQSVEKINNDRDPIIESIVSVGPNWKPNPNLKLELRHRFMLPIAKSTETLAGGETAGETYLLQDPTIHANVTTTWSVLGSKPLTIANRYYAPVSEASRLANSNGVLRTQTQAEWDLNTKVSVGMAAQFRLYLNGGSSASDASTALGQDSSLRYIVGPSATYNFNDYVNAYYSVYTDHRTTGHNRADFSKADLTNILFQEFGANFTVGPVLINPAYATYGEGKNNEYYAGFHRADQSEYWLNIIANF